MKCRYVELSTHSQTSHLIQESARTEKSGHLDSAKNSHSIWTQLNLKLQPMLEEASKHLSLLRVEAHTSMSVDDLLLIYFALIRLVCVPFAWCTKGQHEKLEQQRVLKICYSPNCTCMKEMMNSSHWRRQISWKTVLHTSWSSSVCVIYSTGFNY